MKPSKTTALDDQPNSFAKLFASPAPSSSRSNPKDSRESIKDHDFTRSTDGEATLNTSKSSRPGGRNPLDKGSSMMLSSTGIPRGGQEHEITAPTELLHHKTKEEKVKTLKILLKQSPTSKVAVEIAFLVESLKASNHISEEIINKCREGELMLEHGSLLVKQAQQRLELLLEDISD